MYYKCNGLFFFGRVTKCQNNDIRWINFDPFSINSLNWRNDYFPRTSTRIILVRARFPAGKSENEESNTLEMYNPQDWCIQMPIGLSIYFKSIWDVVSSKETILRT